MPALLILTVILTIIILIRTSNVLPYERASTFAMTALISIAILLSYLMFSFVIGDNCCNTAPTQVETYDLVSYNGINITGPYLVKSHDNKFSNFYNFITKENNVYVVHNVKSITIKYITNDETPYVERCRDYKYTNKIAAFFIPITSGPEYVAYVPVTQGQN